jgi:hypothetical protein
MTYIIELSHYHIITLTYDIRDINAGEKNF